MTLFYLFVFMLVLVVDEYFIFPIRSFYKHVLGLSVDFQDLTVTEPDYAKTLQQILSNPLDLLMIDLTFSAEIQRFGRTEVVDLIPDGSQIAVTGAASKFDRQSSVLNAYRHSVVHKS